MYFYVAYFKIKSMKMEGMNDIPGQTIIYNEQVNLFSIVELVAMIASTGLDLQGISKICC